MTAPYIYHYIIVVDIVRGYTHALVVPFRRIKCGLLCKSFAFAMAQQVRGYSLVVKRGLAMAETGVRFSLPAQQFWYYKRL